MRRTTTTGARFLFKTRRRAASVLRPFLSLSLSRARARARIEENLFFSLFFCHSSAGLRLRLRRAIQLLNTFYHFLPSISSFFLLPNAKEKKRDKKKEEGRTRDVVVVVVVVAIT